MVGSQAAVGPYLASVQDVNLIITHLDPLGTARMT